MPTTQQLREQRANIWSQMTEINDAATAAERWSPDQRTTYDNLETEYDRLDTDIARAEKHEARSVENSQVDRRGVVAPAREEGSDVTYDSAFVNFLKGGNSRLSNEERDVLMAGAVDPSEIRNALSVGTNSAGGYLVPPGYRDEFIVQMKAYGAVQDVAQVVRTDSGQPLQWPTMNDTGNVGRLLSENTQLTQTDVVIGTATLGAYTYSSDLTTASLQLVNDAAFDVKGLVQKAHAERIGRITNQHFTTGTGSSQPQGIVTGATSGVTAAGAAAITSDELIDLQHSVDPAYRNERSKFMLNDTTLKAIRKLKYTGSGEYIFQPGVAGGVPSQIAGSGYVVNQDMASPATGVKSVLYGDFESGYVVRIVQDIQVIVFTERYLDYLQVGYSSFMRADGKVQNTSAYKALTQA